MTIQEILQKLENAKKSANGWTARCPAHDDKSNSLSIAEKDDKILLKCFAGCEVEAVVAALGIEMKDLFLSSGKPAHAQGSRAKKLVAEYVYTDEHGHPVAKKLRYEPGPRGCKKTFSWMRFESGEWKHGLEHIPGRPETRISVPLYRWPEVKDSPWALLVEGEKDADTATRLDLPGTTTGGVNTWTDAHAEALHGKKIVILADADEPGRINARKIAQSIWKAHQGHKETALLKLLELPGSKDLTEAVEKGTRKKSFLS